MGYGMLIFLIVTALVCYGAVTYLCHVKQKGGRYDSGWDTAFFFHTGFGWAGWLFLFLFFPINMSGVDPNYGSGEVDGYLFEVSHEGVIWKTYEATILVGETEADSIMWFCSAPDAVFGAKLEEMRGNKVKIKFRTWACQPWRIGNWRDEVMGITLEAPTDD